MATVGREYVGLYRLLRVILAGRSCVVWEAMHEDLKQRFALKVLSAEYKSDTETRALLKREFSVGHKFAHPNVVSIHEYGVDRDWAYLAIEFFEGKNLKQALREGPDAIAWQAEKIIEQAAQGLHYLHEQGWVHRDIKPDNILVNAAGDVKLI
ncbi:MAG: serine/threonine protein kinase, partial [Planctomycetales bacterium]|nr:serine/threonine protein kinase [Planctomycetales bacterium]